MFHKKVIVTTTINYPTEALIKYSLMKDWKLIVVGDLKTPHRDFLKMKNIIYLSPNNQKKLFGSLSDLIGWNCIQRRNLGFVYAKKVGAEIIATVDDDNIPKRTWGKNIIINKKIRIKKFITNNIVFDPISVTNHKDLWHRGYPLELIKKKNNILKKKDIFINDINIQADFWDGDPDVDAIERLTLNFENCKFKKKYFPFTSNKISPFNSQNTFLSNKVLKHYFMFPNIGRMDDIWASYYVQSLGYKVAYCESSVVQKRNVHNYIKDLKKEVIGYLNNYELVLSLIKNPLNIKKFIPKKSYRAFMEYQKYF